MGQRLQRFIHRPVTPQREERAGRLHAADRTGQLIRNPAIQVEAQPIQRDTATAAYRVDEHQQVDLLPAVGSIIEKHTLNGITRHVTHHPYHHANHTF